MRSVSRGLLLGIIAALLVTSCRAPSMARTLAQPLQDTLNQQRRDNDIRGISAAVILPDGSMWLGASGISTETEAMSSTKVFGLGSITKTIIAALVVELEQQGALSVYDPIGAWIPEVGYPSGGITIHQLLNHTSGLYRYQESPEYTRLIRAEPDRIWTPQEILATFQGEPVCEPGTCWGESSLDYVLLGMIIEKATGTPVEDLLSARFFTPLGLEHIYLYPDQTYPVEDMAHAWRDVTGYGEYLDLLDGAGNVPLAALFSSLWTAGGLHATAEDLAILIKGLYEANIIDPRTLERMLAQGPELASGVYYGYSVVIDEINGQRAYWHSGGAAYASNYTYFPDTGLTIVVLCNQMVNPGPIALALHQVILGQEQTPEPTAQPTP